MITNKVIKQRLQQLHWLKTTLKHELAVHKRFIKQYKGSNNLTDIGNMMESMCIRDFIEFLQDEVLTGNVYK